MRWVSWLSLLVLGSVACQRDGLPVDDGGGDAGCRELGEDTSFRCSPRVTRIPERQADILFVIDNSGTMGPAQGKLARAIETLTSPLDAAEISYRVGITTTDNGNPWCAGESESGALVARACTGRLGDFLIGVGEPTDVGDVACTDQCSLEPSQLEALMRPTPDAEGELAVRPWVETTPGWSNIPDGVTPAQALACFLPQGIVGCAFESPLEGMARAIARAEDPEDPNYGFVRGRAVLAMVFLTDEADCSHNPLQVDAFESGNVLWSDPDALSPTSALCWNAGVECTGGPGSYDECHAVDKTVDGTPAGGVLDAVLYPMERYREAVQSAMVGKGLEFERPQLVMQAVVGVPEGYGSADLGQLYADAADPLFQGDFGIGPGCLQADTWNDAVPPVRIRELAEDHSEEGLFSVCADDYAPALARVAARIVEQMQPACYHACVRDSDDGADGLQPECVVQQQDVLGGDDYALPPCAFQAGSPVVPEDAEGDACYVPVSDPEQMSPACAEGGHNLEFRVVRRPGVLPSPTAQVYANCIESETPTIDCPGLDG